MVPVCIVYATVYSAISELEAATWSATRLLTGDGPAVTVLARSAAETAAAKVPFMPVRVKRSE